MAKPTELVTGSEVTPEQRSTFADAWNKFTSTPSLATLAALGGPTLVTGELEPNLYGAYSSPTDTLAINTNQNLPGQVLETLIHEFTHRAQYQSESRKPPKIDKQSQAKIAADKAYIDYGPGEAAAWIVANMLYAPGRIPKPNALKFIDENRAEANRIFAEGVNPHLPKQQHMKAYQEMNLVEKALNAVIGYQPTLPTPTDKLPPWVESAISDMKKFSNGN